MRGIDFLEVLRRLIGRNETDRCAKNFGTPDDEFYNGITNAEALAFYVYATANGWHRYINQQLWSGNPTPDVRAFAGVLNSGLGKLPAYKTQGGTVYRGYNAPDLDAFGAHYQVNQMVLFPAFTSASFFEASAFGGNVLFIIRALSARAIWFLSPTFHEEEALLPTDCTFEVIETRFQDAGGRHEKLVIVLQETSKRP